MKHAAIIACCVLPLAACDSSPQVSEENASVAEVQDKIARAGGASSFVRPGRWESKVTVEEMSIPGMPAEAASQMKAMTGRMETQQSCLTPEEAKRPKEDFFTGENKNCRYDRFNMAGGKIDAVMKCSADGAEQTMTLAGDYSPDTYNMRMTMQGSGDGMSGMTMKMRVEAKRVGECTGEES